MTAGEWWPHRVTEAGDLSLSLTMFGDDEHVDQGLLAAVGAKSEVPAVGGGSR